MTAVGTFIGCRWYATFWMRCSLARL